jgi:ribulose 1,5-bisphosphate synthetase/thiazole synthase
MDPNVMEAKVVVSACSHDGPLGAHSVKRLATLGMLPAIQGMGALEMNSVCPCLILRLCRSQNAHPSNVHSNSHPASSRHD